MVDSTPSTIFAKVVKLPTHVSEPDEIAPRDDVLPRLAHTILMLVTTPVSVKAVAGWNCRPPVLGGLWSSAGIESLDLLAFVHDIHSPASTATLRRHEVGGMVLRHLARRAPVTLEATHRWPQCDPRPNAHRFHPVIT